MENAVEALKLFLGVTIFAIALTVFFNMTSLAKDTADIVFEAIDQTSLMNYTVDVEDGGNRIVTFQEIMPTIYRYSQEGYGVTIIDGANIVARFDLDTESQVSSCFWDDDRYWKASDSEQKKSNSIKYEIGKYINENIIEKTATEGTNLDALKINLPNESEKEARFNHNDLDRIIKSIYGTISGSDDSVYTGWLKSNTYNNNYITQRINSDIYGDEAYFSLKNPGVNDSTEYEGTHVPYYSQGLLYHYTVEDKSTFKEYIVQIDTNEYIANEDGENTGLLVFGTIRNTKKREIIYVKQEG